MMKSPLVLFLCTGNYYRSRYAEELFNHLAEQKGLLWRAFSRGAAERGSPDNIGPMSRFAREALDAKGIFPKNGRDPQPCCLCDLERAQLVIALNDAEHRPMIERRFPDIAVKVAYWQVEDIEFAPPSVALSIVDDQVGDLISSLK